MSTELTESELAELLVRARLEADGANCESLEHDYRIALCFCRSSHGAEINSALIQVIGTPPKGCAVVVPRGNFLDDLKAGHARVALLRGDVFRNLPEGPKLYSICRYVLRAIEAGAVKGDVETERTSDE